MARKQQHLESFSCMIDVMPAVLSFDKFQDLFGISAASQGKVYQDWSSEDKKRWTSGAASEKLRDRFAVTMRFMASEECFFVRPASATAPYMADLGHKKIVFSEPVVERPTEMGDDEHVDFRVYARNIQGLGWSLTVALYWSDGQFSSDAQESFKILCDIPMLALQDWSEEMQKNMMHLGFDVDSHESLDSHTDEFGEDAYYPNSLSYKKSGVTIYCS